MPRRKENSKILKLKILKQEYLGVKREQKEGDIEIKKALASFRHKITPSDAESFDKTFYGQSMNSGNNFGSESSLSCAEESSSAQNAAHDKVAKPVWAKKIYKSVVTRTHPDKYVNFPVEAIKQKYNTIYIDAVEAWKSSDWKALIVCGYEVEVEVNNEDVNKVIEEGLEEYSVLIKKVQKEIGYQWYHLKEKERYVILENYLRQLGFSFTKEKVVNVVKNLRRESLNRKTGQRPAKKIGVKRPKRP